MKRRDFFKALAVAVAAVAVGPSSVQPSVPFDVLMRNHLVHDLMLHEDRAFLQRMQSATL